MAMDRFNPILQRQLAMPQPDQLPSVAPAAADAQAAATNAANYSGDAADPAYRAKATEAAVKFESFFISHMMHQMRSGARALGADDAQHDSVNSDMLDMADTLVAEQLAGRRAF